MIKQNFFTLKEGSCGVSIFFDEINLYSQKKPVLDSSGNQVVVDNEPVFQTIEPTFLLSDKDFITLEFVVADVYPKNTEVIIIPDSYDIQKPKSFVPQTTVKIKSLYDFGAQVLLQLNIKDKYGRILYTDYQIIIVGDLNKRDCQKAIDIVGGDIILNKDNNWTYTYNDHTIVKIVGMEDSSFDHNILIGKIQRKNKDLLPIRLPSQDNCALPPLPGNCRSKQIAEIPSVSILKRSIADSEQKIGELIYNSSVYTNKDVIKVDINNNISSGYINEYLTLISGDYYTQHLLSYDDGYTNTVSYIEDENNLPQFLEINNRRYDSSKFIAYSIGSYILSIPDNIPMAILNKGNEDKIIYDGINGAITIEKEVSTLTDPNGDFIPANLSGTYKFIKGDMLINVLDGVDDNFLSFYFDGIGFMGGLGKLVYSKQYLPTPTPTPTMTTTPTNSPTPSITPTNTITPSITPSSTPTPSVTATSTSTPTPTPTISITPSITPTITTTPSVTPSNTPTISVTPSITPTISVTPSITPTISVTPSITPTISVTPSITPTISVTPSITPTLTPTLTPGPTNTPTVSNTPTCTQTPSQNIDLPSRIENLTMDIDVLENLVNLSWDPPLYTGISSLIAYVVRYKIVGNPTYSTIQINDPNVNMYSIDGLDLSQIWQFEVAAKNSSGNGLFTIIATNS